MSLPIALGCIIAALVVGCILGGLYRKKVSEREIGSAEEKAKQIINDAYKSAESKRRETLLEAKEEIHKSRTEYEREVKERRAELQKQERRLQQKEETLDRKTDTLDKKTDALNQKIAAIDTKQNEINQLSYIIIKAKARGMKIILNPSPKDAKIFELPLHLIDLFFVNEIEAAGLIKSKLSNADISDNEKLASRLQELFPENDFVLTLGEEGSMYLSSDTQIYQPAFKIKAVDTTAAGDTFTGFFLSGLLHGKNIPASL